MCVWITNKFWTVYDSDGYETKYILQMKNRRPVGLPATGNERHGLQGSTPVSEVCDQ